VDYPNPGSEDDPYVKSGADATYHASSASQDIDGDGDQDISGNVAWYRDNSDTGSGSKTHDVGSKEANSLGLYDMSGNVSEWCFDWNPDYVGSYRVLLGGCFYSTAIFLQVGLVCSCDPFDAVTTFGFRFARIP
jgi:formylglycine-generating enzyme required for sulfatase activity